MLSVIFFTGRAVGQLPKYRKTQSPDTLHRKIYVRVILELQHVKWLVSNLGQPSSWKRRGVKITSHSHTDGSVAKKYVWSKQSVFIRFLNIPNYISWDIFFRFLATPRFPSSGVPPMAPMAPSRLLSLRVPSLVRAPAPRPLPPTSISWRAPT